MRDKVELIKHANIAMIEKLNENDSKPDWTEMSLREMLGGVMLEMDELEDSVNEHQGFEAIRREAADVSNYAAMIVLFCDRSIDKLKQIKNQKSGFAAQTGNRFGGGYGD